MLTPLPQPLPGRASVLRVIRGAADGAVDQALRAPRQLGMLPTCGRRLQALQQGGAHTAPLQR